MPLNKELSNSFFHCSLRITVLGSFAEWVFFHENVTLPPTSYIEKYILLGFTTWNAPLLYIHPASSTLFFYFSLIRPICIYTYVCTYVRAVKPPNYPYQFFSDRIFSFYFYHIIRNSQSVTGRRPSFVQ